jgi:hypothetical protein
MKSSVGAREAVANKEIIVMTVSLPQAERGTFVSLGAPRRRYSILVRTYTRSSIAAYLALPQLCKGSEPVRLLQTMLGVSTTHEFGARSRWTSSQIYLNHGHYATEGSRDDNISTIRRTEEV